MAFRAYCMAVLASITRHQVAAQNQQPDRDPPVNDPVPAISCAEARSCWNSWATHVAGGAARHPLLRGKVVNWAASGITIGAIVAPVRPGLWDANVLQHRSSFGFSGFDQPVNAHAATLRVIVLKPPLCFANPVRADSGVQGMEFSSLRTADQFGTANSPFSGTGWDYQQPAAPSDGQTPRDNPVQPTVAESRDSSEIVPKRILGIIPNYRTSPSLKDYTPLTPKGKFNMARQDSFDRGTFILGALFGGEAQLTKATLSFGQGVPGYARYLSTS
jgi:hypothetical protein